MERIVLLHRLWEKFLVENEQTRRFWCHINQNSSYLMQQIIILKFNYRILICPFLTEIPINARFFFSVKYLTIQLDSFKNNFVEIWK